MKKFLLALAMIVFVLGVLVGTYMLLKNLDDKESLSALEKYNMDDKEIEILSEFKIENHNYKVLKEEQNKFKILAQYKNEFYLLESDDNCITYKENILVHNNEVFVHCTGFRKIDKYLLDNYGSTHESINFNFDKTTNFSPLHMNIEAIDEKYIYFSSLKLDGKIKEGEKVKCALDKKNCEYND